MTKYQAQPGLTNDDETWFAFKEFAYTRAKEFEVMGGDKYEAVERALVAMRATPFAAQIVIDDT